MGSRRQVCCMKATLWLWQSCSWQHLTLCLLCGSSSNNVDRCVIVLTDQASAFCCLLVILWCRHRKAGSSPPLMEFPPHGKICFHAWLRWGRGCPTIRPTGWLPRSGFCTVAPLKSVVSPTWGRGIAGDMPQALIALALPLLSDKRKVKEKSKLKKRWLPLPYLWKFVECGSLDAAVQLTPSSHPCKPILQATDLLDWENQS